MTSASRYVSHVIKVDPPDVHPRSDSTGLVEVVPIDMCSSNTKRYSDCISYMYLGRADGTCCIMIHIPGFG